MKLENPLSTVATEEELHNIYTHARKEVEDRGGAVVEKVGKDLGGLKEEKRKKRTKKLLTVAGAATLGAMVACGQDGETGTSIGNRERENTLVETKTEIVSQRSQIEFPKETQEGLVIEYPVFDGSGRGAYQARQGETQEIESPFSKSGDKEFVKAGEESMKKLNFEYPESLRSVADDLGLESPADLLDESKFPARSSKRVDNGIEYSHILADGSKISLRVTIEKETGLATRIVNMVDSEGNDLGRIISSWGYGDREFEVYDGEDEFSVRGDVISYSQEREVEGNPEERTYEEYDSSLRKASLDVPVLVNETVPIRFGPRGGDMDTRTSHILTGNPEIGYEINLRYKGMLPDGQYEDGIPKYKEVVASFPNISVRPAENQDQGIRVYRVNVDGKESYIRKISDDSGYAGYEYIEGDQVIPEEILSSVLMNKLPQGQ